jgi:hypothetical protein
MHRGENGWLKTCGSIIIILWEGLFEALGDNELHPSDSSREDLRNTGSQKRGFLLDTPLALDEGHHNAEVVREGVRLEERKEEAILAGVVLRVVKCFGDASFQRRDRLIAQLDTGGHKDKLDGLVNHRGQGHVIPFGPTLTLIDDPIEEEVGT